MTDPVPVDDTALQLQTANLIQYRRDLVQDVQSMPADEQLPTIEAIADIRVRIETALGIDIVRSLPPEPVPPEE